MRRRIILITGAVIIIGGGAAAIVTLTGGGSAGHAAFDTGSPSDSAGNTGVSDPNTTCKIEINTEVDVSYNNSGISGLVSVLGMSNPQFTLMENEYGSFIGKVDANGLSTAEDQIAAEISQACQTAGNPLLAQGQVNQLASLSTSADANLLSQINDFAPG